MAVGGNPRPDHHRYNFTLCRPPRLCASHFRGRLLRQSSPAAIKRSGIEARWNDLLDEFPLHLAENAVYCLRHFFDLLIQLGFDLFISTFAEVKVGFSYLI